MISSACHSFSQTEKFLPVDSISSKLLSIPSSMEHDAISTFKKQVQSNLFDSLKQLRSSILSSAGNISKEPIKLINLIIDYNGLTDSSYLFNGDQYYLNDFDGSANWMIVGVPVSMRYQYQSWSNVPNSQKNIFSFHYDRNNYLEELRKKLYSKIKPADLLQKVINPLLEAKQTAENLLKNDLERINQQYGTLLSGTINQIGDPENLFNKQMSSLRNQFLGNDQAKSAQQAEALYTQLLQKKNSGEHVDLKQLKSLEASLLKFKGIEAIINKIEEHKRAWDSSGLVKKMKEWDILQKQSLNNVMKDPGLTIKSAREFLNLNGFQKLLLKFSKLSLGQNTLSLSPLSISHFINNGIATEFLNNKNSLMLLMGKQQDYNSLLDMPFTNNIFSTAGNARAISFGTGMNKKSTSYFTVSSFTQTLSSINVPAALSSFRRSLVTTFSNNMNIGANGVLTTEVSRSSSEYINDSLGQSSIKKMLSPEDLWKNTAFSIRYEDEYAKQNLNYQVHVSKTANGYNNPGNIYLNSGSKEFGYSIKKLFLKRKLQVSLKTDLREYKYNEQLDEKWRSIYSVFDLKWKLNKGQYVGIRYMPNTMTKISGSLKSPVSQLNQLSAQGSLSKRIWGLYYHNYINLAYQKNGYSYNNQWLLTKTILLTSNQTLSIGKNTVYITINYNQADNRSQYVFFNSSFVTEAGSSYVLFKKLNASSSLTYNAIKDWYQQIGIRQTVAMQLGQKFNLSMFVDARKNIRVYQPLWFGLLRADVSLHYQLKN